jgi:hypothetical protein
LQRCPKLIPGPPDLKAAAQIRRADQTLLRHGKPLSLRLWRDQLLWPTAPMEFWVAMEILDHLEKVTDSLDDVANEIHSIVTEHV